MAQPTKSQTDSSKCIHDGHRQRLVELVYNAGIENLSSIQALEYVLCYIFPRGDVNPLAHRLLDRFKDFPTILEASIEDLQEVKGMGDASAKKLHSLLEIFHYYLSQKLNGKFIIKTTGEFYDYIEHLLRYRENEELHIFGVNSLGEVTEGRRFGKGNMTMVGFNIRDAILYLSTHKVDHVILVHNHPNGGCEASVQDVKSYDQLKQAFKLTGGTIIDMVIVGIDGIYSMERICKVRLFNVGEEYTRPIEQLNCPPGKIEKQ